jgi:hypothetical protein
LDVKLEALDYAEPAETSVVVTVQVEFEAEAEEVVLLVQLPLLALKKADSCMDSADVHMD